RLVAVELLTHVAEDGDGLGEAVVLLQPGDRTGGVEPARVGEDGGGLSHARSRMHLTRCDSLDVDPVPPAKPDAKRVMLLLPSGALSARAGALPARPRRGGRRGSCCPRR